jgi:hypothetical protein
MGFLDSIKSMFVGGGEGRAEPGHWIYVRCNRCGEVIKTRLDLRRNLSPRDEGGFMAHKTLVGNQLCFERIEVNLTFDENHHLVGREISRGEFITAEEYEAAQSDTQA